MRQFVSLTRGDNEGDCSPESIRDHTGLGAIADEVAQAPHVCLAQLLESPFSSGPCCLLMLVPLRNVIPRSTPFA